MSEVAKNHKGNVHTNTDVNKSNSAIPTMIKVIPASEAGKIAMAENEKSKGNEEFRAGDFENAILYYTRSLWYYLMFVCL